MANNDQDPYNRIGERTTGWFGRRAQGLANSKHPVLKVTSWVALLVAVIIGINIAAGVINLGSGYIQAARQVLSADNIRTQRTEVIRDWQSLLAATGTACQVVNQPANQNAPTIVENPALAYSATVRNIRADYNRRQHNLFEAEVVGPPGYPRTVPDQAQMDSAKPNWCQINQDLGAVHS